MTGKLLIVHYINSDNNGMKAAFTVSKKVSKLAVKRNKLKRRLKEIYRLNRHILPIDTWLIIRAKPDASGVSFYELQTELIHLITEIATKINSNRVD